MTARTIRICLTVAVSLGASCAALAQQPAAPAAPAAAAAAAPAPKHACVHPEEFPGKLASEMRLKAWQREFVEYTNCLRKFVEDQQALAKPHVDAANAAVVEYNNSVKEYNETMQKAKED
ncbi:MAG TPA: hypothetical protein VKT00_00585 [Casimicrobiaceae bacterium]|nr:hypothetical protein [Casimicrobiaceae bacterium]